MVGRLRERPSSQCLTLLHRIYESRVECTIEMTLWSDSCVAVGVKRTHFHYSVRSLSISKPLPTIARRPFDVRFNALFY